MKSIFTFIATVLMSAQASADVVLVELVTEQGEPAYLIADKETKVEFGGVFFGAVTLEINGRTHRIAKDSQDHLLEILCADHKSIYAYTYASIDTRSQGLFGLGAESAVSISREGVVSPSDDNFVIYSPACLKSMY